MSVGAVIEPLLEGLFDYAGLFPPAALDMPTTVASYAAYRAGREAWMLGRLVVPVGRLPELQRAAASLPGQAGPAWPISALTAVDRLDAELEQVVAFNQRHDGRAAIDAVELKAQQPDEIEEAIDVIPEELAAFFELPLGRDVRGLVATLAGTGAGAKARTGGVEPEAYPPPDALARFIAACASAQVPFKATAGLHHPLCHRNEDVGAREFGFLNVITAAAAAVAGTTAPDDLIEILTAGSAEALCVSDGGLRLDGHALSASQIRAGRTEGLISIGTCSFQEPLDELRALDLL